MYEGNREASRQATDRARSPGIRELDGGLGFPVIRPSRSEANASRIDVMKTLTARTADGVYAVVIEADPMSEIDRLCSTAGEVETGGILIGCYSEDRSTALVSEVTSSPPDSRKHATSFVRGVVGLREILRQRWRAKERKHYIGEWHFHPATTVVPSSDDFDQMKTIAQDRAYSCKEPILLILGQSARQGNLRPVRVFVFSACERPMEMFPGCGASKSLANEAGSNVEKTRVAGCTTRNENA